MMVSTVLHNLFFAIFGFEDGVFFILTFLALFGMIGYLLYNIYTYFVRKEPKDLWMVGFAGLVLLAFLLIVGMNDPVPYVVPGILCLFFVFRWL